MCNFKITLRAARVNAGYSLEEVAEKIGKSVATIAKYQRDSSNIPRLLLLQLLDLYAVPADVIFFGRESDFIAKMRAS